MQSVIDEVDWIEYEFVGHNEQTVHCASKPLPFKLVSVWNVTSIQGVVDVYTDTVEMDVVNVRGVVPCTQFDAAQLVILRESPALFCIERYDTTRLISTSPTPLTTHPQIALST